MEKLTVQSLTDNLDEIMEKVESGESFLIEDDDGTVVMIPYANFKSVMDLIDPEYLKQYNELNSDAP